MPKKRLQQNRAFLWIVVALLLLYFALRLHDLLALPLFIDEMIHAEQSADVWRSHPLWFGIHGRYLGIWWLAAFWPFNAVPWLARGTVLLLTLPGAAAIFALGRRVYRRGTGTLVLVLATFTPMLFFFDRMGLADTTLHATISAFTLSLFWLYDRDSFRPRHAIIAGTAFALAVLAKATALTIAPLALVAVVLLPRKWTLPDRVKSLLWLFGTTFVLWLPLLIFMRRSNVDYLSIAAILSTEQSGITFIEKALTNTRFLVEGLWTYFGALPLLAGVIPVFVAVLSRPRHSLTIAAAAFGPATALVVFGSLDVSMRYWVIMIPLSLVLVAGGLLQLGAWLTEAARRARHRIGTEITLPKRGYISPAVLLPILVTIPWLIWVVFPFISVAYTDPTALNLPPKDHMEYIAADSSGVMIPEVADFLVEESARVEGSITVSGAIASCYTLYLYTPQDAPVTVECPNVLSGERRGAWLDAHLLELAAQYEHFYAVFERPGLTLAADVSGVTLEPLADFPRPQGPDGVSVTLTVYRVVSGD